MNITLRNIKDNIVAAIFIIVLGAIVIGLLAWPILKVAAVCKFLFR